MCVCQLEHEADQGLWKELGLKEIIIQITNFKVKFYPFYSKIFYFSMFLLKKNMVTKTLILTWGYIQYFLNFSFRNPSYSPLASSLFSTETDGDETPCTANSKHQEMQVWNRYGGNSCTQKKNGADNMELGTCGKPGRTVGWYILPCCVKSIRAMP